MSHDHETDRPLIVTAAAALISRHATEDAHSHDHESAYRRGVHQAIAICSGILTSAKSWREARWDLECAERIAEDLRRDRRHEGSYHLIDKIKSEVDAARARRRRRA